MSGLTREERGRMIKGFLMTSGGIALAMVLFALIGQLGPATFILIALSTVMVGVTSPLLWLLDYPARVVYNTMSIGLAVITGAVGGSLIINMVVSAFH